MQNIDQNALSLEERRIVSKYFDKIEAIDEKMLVMKLERRAMADYFVKLALRQKKEAAENADDRPQTIEPIKVHY
jgi:hypothetical protein